MNRASNRKVALVTGAASGIGLAIAERLASVPGVVVCAVDLDEAGLRAACLRIQARGGEAHPFGVDLADETALGAMCDAVVHTVGDADIVVNNAGLGGIHRFDDIPKAHWDKVIAVNLTAAFLLAQRFVPSMRRKQWGRIINVSSINGYRAGSGRAAYGTTKTAIIGLTRQIAIDVSDSGITSNAVAPGVISTPMMRSMVPAGSESEAALMRSVPMNRCGTPEDVAGVVAFLASPDANYVTGCTIPVDGGFVASGIYVRNLFEDKARPVPEVVPISQANTETR